MRLPLKLATPRSMTRSWVGCLAGSGGGSSKTSSKSLQLTAPIPKAPSSAVRIVRWQATKLLADQRRLTARIVRQAAWCLGYQAFHERNERCISRNGSSVGGHVPQVPAHGPAQAGSWLQGRVGSQRFNLDVLAISRRENLQLTRCRSEFSGRNGGKRSHEYEIARNVSDPRIAHVGDDGPPWFGVVGSAVRVLEPGHTVDVTRRQGVIYYGRSGGEEREPIGPLAIDLPRRPRAGDIASVGEDELDLDGFGY